MHVVTLCGSLHSGSTNAVVLAHVAARLEDHGVTVEAVDVSGDVPAFRPEQVDAPPDSVAAIRDAFRSADGVAFAVPEYAGGMPGWVKNVLDWMVGAAALYVRPVIVVSAATAGGHHAIEQLTRTLTWQGAHVVATCSIPAPLTMVRGSELTDATVVERLGATTDRLLAVLRAEQPATDAASAVLEPLGMSLDDRLA